jgi:predicted amidohydrolase YtcJ
MIIHNANFYIRESFDNQVLGLRVDSGRITEFLYRLPENLPMLPNIDLNGNFAYPAFTDCHTHCFSGGLYQSGVDLSACANIADLLEILSEKAKKIPKGGFLFAWKFDETRLPERRFPTQREIDSACHGINLLIRRVDGHSCMASSCARKQIAGIGSGDEIIRGADNDITTHWFHRSCDDHAILKAYQNAAQTALQGGFGTVHTMVGDADQGIDHYRLIQSKLSVFPIRYIPYPQSFNIEAALKVGSPRVGGCILADGSIGSHTAAMSMPYADMDTKGKLYHPDEFWNNFVREANRQRLQVCVHCIGDQAIRQVNNAYLKAAEDDYQDLRHQLIHCEVVPDELILRIKASGAVPVMQPNFDLLWGGPDGLYETRLGKETASRMNRFGSFTRHGIRAAASSDWYVTDMNVAMSIWAAINHHNPAERISAAEAIRMYTTNAAWLIHEEARTGELDPGFMADLSVLDTDLTRQFNYQDVSTRFVIREGKVVFSS